MEREHNKQLTTTKIHFLSTETFTINYFDKFRIKVLNVFKWEQNFAAKKLPCHKTRCCDPQVSYKQRACGECD